MFKNSGVIRIANKMKSKLCHDPYILILLVAIFVTRLYIFSQTVTIYYVDSHYYLAQAMDFSQGNNTFGFSRGFPFMYYLAAFARFSLLFSNDPTVIVKSAMFVLNLCLFPVIYLALKKLMDSRYAFLSVILMAFDAALIEYSLVPYLELFALLMGWLATLMIFGYFSERKVQLLFLGFIFCLVSFMTRFEMSLVFSIPILLTVTVRSFILKQHRRIIALIWISLMIFFILYVSTLMQYYYSTTRFDPITRLIMGLNFNVIVSTAASIPAVTDNYGLNLAYGLLSLVGFIWLSKSVIFSSRNQISTGEQGSYDKYSRALFIMMTIASISVTLVFYGYSYTIVDGSVVVIPQLISTRFLMLVRSFSAPLFAYGLYKSSATLRSVLSASKLKRKPEMARKIAGGMTIALLVLYLPATWSYGITAVETGSASMNAYRDTAIWLSSTVNINDSVFLPVEIVFYVYSPSLRSNSLSYSTIWNMAGVVYKADTTFQELVLVRETLVNYIKQHPNVRFLVKDWMDPISQVFNLNINDELYNLTRIAHEEQVKSGSYRPVVVVYEVINHTSSPP